MNSRDRAKEVANNQKELDLSLLTEEAKIMATPFIDDMDPTQWA
jgi:hypothetical protein